MTKTEWFFRLAKTVADKSKDRSTKVGCVVIGTDDEVRSLGYNGFVRGANDAIKEWHERPLKYDVTIHAEENAVAAAARIGVSLKECIAYTTLPPCSRCSRLLVQSGIYEVRFLIPLDNRDWIERWADDFGVSTSIMRAGRMRYCGYSDMWDEEIGDANEYAVGQWLSEIEGYSSR